jgi:hypothetical protein
MRMFLIEAYEPRAGKLEPGELERRARAAAERLALDGTDVRYVRSIYVPEDETHFHVVEADSADAVTSLAALAGLEHERILEAT